MGYFQCQLTMRMLASALSVQMSYHTNEIIGIYLYLPEREAGNTGESGCLWMGRGGGREESNRQPH